MQQTSNILLLSLNKEEEEIEFGTEFGNTLQVSNAINENQFSNAINENTLPLPVNSSSPEWVIPDGGTEAWLVIMASWLVHVIVIGIPTSFGVFKQKYASDPSTYEGPHSIFMISLIGSVLNSGIGALAIPSGRWAEVYGHRRMAVIGGICVALSLLLASFAENYWQLLLTFGFLFGLSCPIAYFPALTIIGHYFSKRKGLAIGIAVSGSGVGGFMIAPLCRFLISSGGTKFALRILSIISLSVILFASYFLKPKLTPSAKGKFDYLSIIKDGRFIRLFLIAVFSSLGYFVPFFYTSSYAVYHGMSVTQGAFLVGIINGSSGIGRIALGFNADIMGPVNTLWACLTFASMSILLIWPFATNFGTLILFTFCYGLSVGGFISLLPACIIHLFGTKDIATITGMVYTGFFFGNLFGPPCSGLLLDYLTDTDPTTGLQTVNYIPSILLSGICIFISSFILLMTKLKLGNGNFFVKI